MPENEVSEEVLEEGCYYLSTLGMSFGEIARHFEVEEAKARSLASSHASKLDSGDLVEDPFDLAFWQDVKREAEGDIKLTFLSDKGFHHSWKSELSKLDGAALMNIYESSRDFLNADPNQRFLDFQPPRGYDPLAIEREVRKSLEIVQSMLEALWRNERTAKGSRNQGVRREKTFSQ